MKKATESRAESAWLEYTPLASDERWRVERFADLRVEFSFTGGPVPCADQMTQFHELGLSAPRPWALVRQLFGINPLLLPDGAEPDDFATFTRAEVCARHGLDKAQLQAELDTLRALWNQIQKRTPVAGEAEVASAPRRAAPPGLQTSDSRLQTETAALELFPGAATLRACGFNERMFEGILEYDSAADANIMRDPVKNRDERDWFVKRCAEWAALFREPSAWSLVREALLTELDLLRAQDQMAKLTPGMKEHARYSKLKADTLEQYRGLLAKLESMFPDLNTAGRVVFRQTVAALFAGEQDFYGDQNNVRRDAVFTAAELQVLMRQSVQCPEPQYRLSTALLVTEAIHGLYDRNFRSQLARHPRQLKAVDAAVRAAINTAREASGLALVDLENGVTPEEGSNYEELMVFEAKEKEEAP